MSVINFLAQAAFHAPPEVAFAMRSWPLLLPDFGLSFSLLFSPSLAFDPLRGNYHVIFIFFYRHFFFFFTAIVRSWLLGPPLLPGVSKVLKNNIEFACNIFNLTCSVLVQAFVSIGCWLLAAFNLFFHLV